MIYNNAIRRDKQKTKSKKNNVSLIFNENFDNYYYLC